MLVRRHAVALVAVLLLAGCSGDDPDPVADPVPTASSSAPAAEPSPTVSPEPSDKPEATEAFLDRWLSEFALLQSTGDGVQFRAMSKRCTDCIGVADRYQGIYAAGGWIRGGEITVKSMKRVNESATEETWIIRMVATPTRYKESETGEVMKLPGGVGAFRLIVEMDPLNVVELFQEAQ